MDEVMNQADVELLATAAEGGAVASTTAQSSNSPSPASSNGQEPCSIINRAMAALPAGARPIVPAELGVQCLQSVPLDRDGNARLIDDMMLFVKWQSNVAYLKNPPEGYTEQPIDIMGKLSNMKSRLSPNGFKNEYGFQTQMMSICDRAYDNHFAWQPDVLASAMQFQRPPGTELASISIDDVLKANNGSSFKPLPVRIIDGMTARDYLANASTQGDFHDADTRWNAMFPSQALIATGLTFLGAFRTGIYTGPNTTMQFENGTTLSMPNLAVMLTVQTPQQSATPTGNLTRATPTATPTPSHIGYPKAEIINPNLAMGGYYISGNGYEDVAVLSIPTYDSPDVQSFQNTMRDFILKSKADGKTKIIFDLRGNGGGNAILGYDTFKQVYLEAVQEPFGGTRSRANDALNQAGKITQKFLAGKTLAQSNRTAFEEAFGRGTTQDDIFGFTSAFNYQHTLDVNNQDRASWEQLFGPEQVVGDAFTPTLRYNFSDSISTTYTGFSVMGYNENKNETATPQPFHAQDMVMLHDGMCSSTCAIVSELLKNQGAVRTIAIGGRPQSGPLQGVGGTKGAQVFSWDDIQVRMQALFFLGSPEQRAHWNNTDLGRTAFATQLFRRSAYQDGRIAGGVNLKDNLRQGDASKTPLEFMYEAADCRMFFTAGMYSDVTLVWKGVADRMFRTGEGLGMGMCVEGSTGDKTSVSGGGQFRGGDGKINEVEASKGAANGTLTGPAGGRASGSQQYTGRARRIRMDWRCVALLGLGMVVGVS
ncbi:peptidase S41 family protein [Setomelanomma holmii]|uniref:Peptidase S41 family protein n=1 Tax=Setomelanomma holmii TaxID=210430 RepID=A0A9P4LIN9_9PLEO|nr:peptidase S41 family protein [Setomelanomma holmii]